MPSVFGQAFEVARHIVAADHVQHGLHPLPAGEALDLRDIILGAVVDRFVRAPALGSLAFFVRSAGHDDLDVEQVAQADRHRADPAGAAMDQHGVATDGIGPLEQVGPYGEEGFRQRRCLHHVIVRRDRQALARRRHRILRIAPARQQRAYALADQHIRTAPGRDDRAGDFQPRNVRSAGRWRIFALSLQDVGPVDAGGGDPDQHLVIAGNGQGAAHRHQRVGTTGRGDAYRHHLLGQGLNVRHRFPLKTPDAAMHQNCPIQHPPILTP